MSRFLGVVCLLAMLASPLVGLAALADGLAASIAELSQPNVIATNAARVMRPPRRERRATDGISGAAVRVASGPDSVAVGGGGASGSAGEPSAPTKISKTNLGSTTTKVGDSQAGIITSRSSSAATRSSSPNVCGIPPPSARGSMEDDAQSFAA